jgi:hypothetical protein
VPPAAWGLEKSKNSQPKGKSMNSDSFLVLRSDYPSGHPFQLQTLTGSTTAEQLFLVTGSTTAVVQALTQGTIVGSMGPFDPNIPQALSGNPIAMGAYQGRPRPFFQSSSFDGRAFRIRATGKYNNQAATTNAQTVTFYITQGNAASSSKRIASVSSGTNLASGPCNFIVEATVLWDSAMQVLAGEFWGNITNGTTNAYTTRAGLANLVGVSAYTGLQFCCSIVFGTSSASSTANLVEFSMEQV